MFKTSNSREIELVNEMIQDNERLLSIYNSWKVNKQIEDIDLLQWNVATFIKDCRYTINRGSARSVGKSSLGKKITSMMEGYINFWSLALLEIKRESLVLSTSLQDNYYKTYFIDQKTEVKAIRLRNVLKKHNAKKYKQLGIKRDY